MLAISCMKDRERKEMMKKKKTKRTKGETRCVLSARVCVWLHRGGTAYIFFSRTGRKGGKEKRNLNSNVYFRFELIEKAKREGFQGGRAHCYAEIEKQNA